jgi:hypothetical protein
MPITPIERHLIGNYTVAGQADVHSERSRDA